MSREFKVSLWEVGTWILLQEFRAYHEAHEKFYLKELNLDEVQGDFDVSVAAVNDEGTTLVSGLYSGVIQFWDIQRTDMVLEIPSHLSEVTALVYNHDHSILASAGADYLINVWNSKTNQLLFEIRE